MCQALPCERREDDLQLKRALFKTKAPSSAEQVIVNVLLSLPLLQYFDAFEFT